MLYIVTNDFDEQIRLVRANGPDEAIAKAQLSISPQEIAEVGEQMVQRWKRINEIWKEAVASHERHQEWRRKNGYPLAPEMKSHPDASADPESFRDVHLEDYNWEVLQEIDPDKEIAILEGLCL